jgi:hypothetical protein
MADQENIGPINQGQPANQAQVVQRADGINAHKVKQTKLPEFWGNKNKDSITGNEFVKRIDNMVKINNWACKVANTNFAMMLQGLANTWLESQVTLKNIKGDREK